MPCFIEAYARLRFFQVTSGNQYLIECQIMGNIKRGAFLIVRGSIVDMGSNAYCVTEILNAFACQQINVGKGTMRFVAGLIKTVKVFLLIQKLELFLHFRKPVQASIPMTKQLFRSDEVMKPDGFENIAVNWCEGIGLFKWFAVWLCQGCAFHRSTFSLDRSGTTG